MKLLSLITTWFIELSKFCPRIRKRKILEKPFLIIGHRGSPAAEAENTIPSFEKALNENANALEMDICVTKDNIPIIYHDWNPDSLLSLVRENGFEPYVKYKPLPPSRFSVYRKPVNQLTLHEISKYYGYTLKNNGNENTIVRAIPTLEEFFSWSADKNNLKYVFLDIKVPPEFSELSIIILDLVKKYKEKYQTGFEIVFETAFTEVLDKMKINYPDNNYLLDIEIPPGFILNPKNYSAVKTAIEKQNQFALLMRPRQFTLGSWTTYRRAIRYDLKTCSKYLKMNLKNIPTYFICATINEQTEMKCLIKMGINGIITDFPAQLRNNLEKYKRTIA